MTVSHKVNVRRARFAICAMCSLLILLGQATLYAGGLIVVTKKMPAGANDVRIVPPRPIPIPRPRPGPPMVRPVYQFAPLSTRIHKVEVTITDQIATTFIDQTFYNPNRARLEGDFIFPLPKGAQIDKFTMDVNGKQTPAELLDATKARKIYTDIVRSARDPALLEYVGQGMLKCRIFPIEPLSEKRITLKYTQLLKNDSGIIGYQFPLSSKKYGVGAIQELAFKVILESKQTIKSIYSPSHEVKIKRSGPNRAVLIYEDGNVRPDTDFHVYYSTQAANGGDVGLNLMVFNDPAGSKIQDDPGGFFMMLASPGVPAPHAQVVKKDVVFVLDTSGSMAGAKIDQAKKALTFCVHNLNDGDRFQVVRFGTEVESMFDGLVTADKAHRKQANEFVDSLRAIGGTAIDEAMAEALRPLGKRKGKNRPYIVIFLTDGRPTIGETDEDKIVKGVSQIVGDQQARIFCFGIGTDINTHLLDKITERTKAFSQYVLPKEDIEIKVSNFYTRINHPVLANMKMTVTSNEAKAIRVQRMRPSNLPDLFKGDQLVVFGRYQGSGEAQIVLEGSVNGQPKRFIYEAKFTKEDKRHHFIPKLWATRHVGYLLDKIRLHGQSDELKDEVTRLARRYGIVTPYTAYLIVEDEANRNVPADRRALSAAGGRRMELEKRFRGLRENKSGAQAVADADAALKLKVADKLNAPKKADEAARQVATTPRSRPTGGKPAVTQSASGNSSKQSPRFGASPGRGSSAGEASDDRGRDGEAREDTASATRSIDGRTFYRNGKLWIDALCQSKPNAKQVTIVFDSDEYYELIANHPEAVKFFSLGRNLQLVLGDKIYQIVEKDTDKPDTAKKKAAK